MPPELEKIYHKLIKCCLLGIRNNAPNKVVLIESPMLPLESLIFSRQLKFYKRFSTTLPDNSPRNIVFQLLLNSRSDYIYHYKNLAPQYESKKNITREYRIKLSNEINQLAMDDKNYKYFIYKKFNPNLVTPNLSYPYETFFEQSWKKIQKGSF